MIIRKGRLIRTLREMIEIPSVTGNEDKISAYVKKELEELGLAPSVDEVGNVYAELGEGKKSLMLNAHFDTVPPEGYRGDPYKSVIRQNKIVGLGSSDCKAGLATMMEMARVWDPKKGKLVLAFTVCEESVLKNEKYTKGSMYAAEKYSCDGCIVLEPTMYDGIPKISGGCRGRMILELKVLGKTTHSSRPKTGRNAITESMKLIKELQEHDLLTGHYFGNELPETLSIVGIKAGAKATNIIPGECDVVVDYRTLPGRTDVVSRIKKSIAESKVKTEVEIPYFSPGYVLEEKSPLITGLHEEVKSSFKKDPTLMVALGRADAEYFSRNGTPSVIYGPGENHQCHKPGEYTLITSLMKCTDSVYNFANKFLQ